MIFFKVKQIDKIITKTFVFYFIAILGITVFVSLMSVFYEYMQIIIDKNLGFDVYFRIILNCALVFSRMGCNIAIIIAAVLCFVKLSEGLEICAMKTFGVTFNRMLKSLSIPTLIIFLFVSFASHYLVPKSMKNTIDLLMDVQKLNPAVMIKEGIFNNDIPGVSIFVKKKNKDNELKNVIVYDHSNKNNISNTLLLAENAKLNINKNDNSMSLNMANGINYLETNNESEKNIGQSIKMKFDNQDILIDMNKIKNKNLSQSSQMKTTLEIINIIDLKNNIINNNIKQIINFIEKRRVDLFQNKDINEKNKIKEKIIESLKRNKFNDKIIDNSIEIKRLKSRNFEEIESCNRAKKYYSLIILERIIQSLACILFLILGASIGVLLKRGSFILHLILSFFFIILYYSIDALTQFFISNSLFGVMAPFLVLFPFVLFFYIQATKDSQILNDGLDRVIYILKILIRKIRNKSKLLNNK